MVVKTKKKNRTKIMRTTNATFAVNVFLNQMFLLLRFGVGVECIRRGRGVYIEKLMSGKEYQTRLFSFIFF
jgi:hypothetical protein